MVGSCYLVRSSLGCHALLRGQSVRLPGLDLVNTSKLGELCPPSPSRSESMQARVGK